MAERPDIQEIAAEIRVSYMESTKLSIFNHQATVMANKKKSDYVPRSTCRRCMRKGFGRYIPDPRDPKHQAFFCSACIEKYGASVFVKSKQLYGGLESTPDTLSTREYETSRRVSQRSVQ